MSQIGARSAFYALPLFLVRSLWIFVAVQALSVSWTLWTLVRVVGPPSKISAFGLVMAVLAFGTGLPFFSAFVMPDIWGGLLILASGMVIAFPRSLTRSQLLGLLFLILYASVTHTSNLALIILAAITGFLILRLRITRLGAATRVMPLLGVLILTFTLMGSTAWGLRGSFGRTVQNPPFLLGRVIADGPGLEFLRKNCERRDFVACELKDPERFGVEGYSGDDLIFPETHWGPQPFSARTDPDRRDRFYAEAGEIILGSLVGNPLDQARSSLRNLKAQLLRFGIRDMFLPLPQMLASDHAVGTLIASITPRADLCRGRGRERCEMRGVWERIDRWHQGVVGFSFLALAVFLGPLFMARARGKGLDPIQIFAIFVSVMVLGNAFVIGAVSVPIHRLQGRVIWLLPLATFLLFYRGSQNLIADALTDESRGGSKKP